MRPIDALTDIDRTTIASYISIYGDAECAPMEITLREWNSNKTRLFKAFGHKLRISKQISIPKDTKILTSQLDAIYHPYIFWYKEDVLNYITNFEENTKLINNEFIEDVLLFWAKKNYCIQDLFTLSRLFLHKNLVKGYLCFLDISQPYHFYDFKCTIKNGMKTIRTIQKVLKATHYPHMDLFDVWRNQVSLIQTSDVIQAKLVLSLHPIDFLTMSDNACNWSSCMSWSRTGCYHAGTLEMMNSNVVAVAYLESDTEYALHLNETGEVYPIPNKSWRSLVFIHKDIIVCGKSYPYHKKNLCFQVLDFVRDIVKTNVNWNYNFINQEYQDMKNIEGNYYLRDWFDPYYDKRRKHHTITFYTNGMYNDIIESKYPHYYCCRNYVEHPLKICLSGPATCICCGKRLNENDKNDIYSYDDLGQEKICWDCKSTHRCRTCGKIHYDMKYHTREGNYCSDECMKDTIIFPNRNRVTCNKDALQFGSQSILAMFYDSNDTLSSTDLFTISESFKSINKIDINSWINMIQQKYPNIFAVYRVPARLTGYKYADVSSWDATYKAKTNDSFYTLCMYNRQLRSNDRIEKNILNLKEYMPLLDFLKGGDN